MKKYDSYEITTDFLHPKFNSKNFDFIYQDGFIVATNGSESFRFVDKSFDTTSIENGTPMKIWLGNRFYETAIKSLFLEYHLWEKEETERIFKEDLQLKQEQEDKEKLEAKNFYDSYEIPFEFRVDIKIVSSGLSYKSAGNGSKSNTITHIVLEENYKNGRFNRAKGEYLCTQPTGKLKDLNSSSDTNMKNNSIVTCKTCLERLTKFKKEKNPTKKTNQFKTNLRS